MGLGLVDLNATYPSLLSVLGLTSHLAADHFHALPIAAGEVSHLLDPLGLRERLDDRGFWREMGPLFAEAEASGEWLPCQRGAGPSWRSVTAPLDLSGGSVIVHVADLIRPALAGRLPRIVRAFRIDPIGVAKGLRPLRLPSGQAVDLVCDDFGQMLVEERRRAELIEDPLVRARRVTLAKSLAVSGAWGVFGRVDRLDRPRPIEVASADPGGGGRRRRKTPRTVEAIGIGPHGEERRKKTDRPDQAGPLTLWHLAAAIPAACRAVVAMAQHDVESAGGSIAAVMTDSLVIPVATTARLEACPGGPHLLPDGRQAVRLLSHDQLRAILRRFDSLLYPDGGLAWKSEAGSLDG